MDFGINSHVLIYVMSTRALTIKQETFSQLYIESGNASYAYRMAYSTENMAPSSIWTEASLLLKNPKVSQRIRDLQTINRHRFAMSQSELMDRMMDLADISAGHKPDPVTGEFYFDAPTALSALKTIGIMCGYYP